MKNLPWPLCIAVLLALCPQPAASQEGPMHPPAKAVRSQPKGAVLGIGGFFFRSKDPKGLGTWYQENLGVNLTPTSYDAEPWNQEAGPTVFAPYDADTGYFGDKKNQWMINFRVRDLDAMVARLRGDDIIVEVDPETYPNGRFARLNDPEGNPIQLWERRDRGGVNPAPEEHAPDPIATAHPADDPGPAVRYLEIVTDDPDGTCSAYARVHGLTFGPADAALGQARVAIRSDGGLVGIRRLLAAHERPITRTYLEVPDIHDAVAKAEAAGAQIAYPPTEQGKRGTFAIFILGGVEHGLWER
jgi:glyoxylase I family protein